MQETRVPSLGWEDPLEKEMATHSSILAWKIPWTEQPAGLQSVGSQSQTHLKWLKRLQHSTAANQGTVWEQIHTRKPGDGVRTDSYAQTRGRCENRCIPANQGTVWTTDSYAQTRGRCEAQIHTCKPGDGVRSRFICWRAQLTTQTSTVLPAPAHYSSIAFQILKFPTLETEILQFPVIWRFLSFPAK